MTKIEWTRGDDGSPGRTWNPVTGCDRVSAGCDNCYALTMARRLKAMGQPAYQRDGDPRTSGPGFGLTVHPDRLDLPLSWRKPARIFVNSMSDLFHPDVPDGFIACVWDVMGRTPWHTYQILTKRPQRMAKWVQRWADRTGDSHRDRGSGMPPMPRGPEGVRMTYTSGRALLFADMLYSMGTPPEGYAYPTYDWMDGQRFWPEVLPNVWLGVSVETQRYADLRIPHLLATPAAVRFLSVEPLLGPVDLSLWLRPSMKCICGSLNVTVSDPNGHGAAIHITGELPVEPRCEDCRRQWRTHAHGVRSIDWVIVGGESGPGARPMHSDWARSIRDQCVAAGVPFLLKQWGAWQDGSAPSRNHASLTGQIVTNDGRVWPWYGIEKALRDANLSSDDFQHLRPCVMANVGKKAAGRELDGREWNEMPG